MLAALLATTVAFARGPVGCAEARAIAFARPPLENPVSIASELRPIRVWYDATHPYSAELAPMALETLERAWQVQVDELGFRAPFLPDAADGPEFDVYLVDYQPYAAFVAGDAYQDPIVGDGYNTSSAFMVVDRELPAIAVPSYLSHEFNHACQYATDFTEPSLPIWEGTATAAQQWTVGDEGHWYHDVPSFQEVPWAPVLTGDGYRIFPPTGLGWTYEYGTAFWVMFLDARSGPGAGTALWEAAANEGFDYEPDAVDAFATVAGASLGEALNAFAIVRFLTGADWDPRGLPDAEGWGPRFAVPAHRIRGSELPLVDFGPDPRPMITGQEFVELDLQDGPPAELVDPWLEISVTSGLGLGTGIAALPWTADGPLDAITAVGSTVEVPAAGLVRLVVATTNLGPPGWDGDDDPYVFGDQRLAIRFVDRGAAPTTIPPEDEDTGGDVLPGDPPATEEPRGCGCRTFDRSGGLLALGLALALGSAIRGGSRPARRRGA